MGVFGVAECDPAVVEVGDFHAALVAAAGGGLEPAGAGEGGVLVHPVPPFGDQISAPIVVISCRDSSG
ncbi:MAG TPA: hypothetical protein VKD26_03035, partial [Streptosporangiaceae bacterium]|nr:hypothetical protein [Streptosporangiaceae bacterium]